METFAILIPILLADVMNPVLFAFMVYAAGSARPVLNSSAMLMGHTAAYFGAGIVISLFIDRISNWLTNPGLINFVIQLVLGVVLLWLAFRTRSDTGKRPDEDSGEFSPMSAFAFGAVVNFIGIPFAVPYFAAIDQILRADPSTLEALVMLVAYNLAYAAPFVVVPLLSAIMGERARPVLARINGFLDRLSGALMPVMLGLIGVAALADALTYFLTGEPLF